MPESSELSRACATDFLLASTWVTGPYSDKASVPTPV